MIVFTLHDATGALLTEIPGTVGWRNSPYQGDPYTWERSPGSLVPFALGDGGWRERPTIELSGTSHYRSRSTLFQTMAAQRDALKIAREVRMYGEHLADLSPEFPGAYTPTWNDRVHSLTHKYVLNITAPVTVETLNAIAASLPDVDEPGTGGGTQGAFWEVFQ